jgi:hypothetical protein
MGVSDGLQVELRVRAGRFTQRYQTAFTVDWTEGLPRLQRGVYLLGLGPTTWARETALPPPGAPVAPALRSVVLTVEAMLDEPG